MHGHGYSNYTNLVYKVLFNKSAKELKEEKGLKTYEQLRDSFEGEKLQAIKDVESAIKGFLATGYEYEEIKERVENGLIIDYDFS